MQTTASPTPITGNQLLSQLRWRYATKKFDPTRKISPEDWAALEESLILTASSFGLQPWKFIDVTDQPTREKLVAASWGQRQVADASHVVVFTIKKNLGAKEVDDYIKSIAQVRNINPESLAAYREMMTGGVVEGMDDARRGEWATRQVYIALGNFMTSAALLGIDTCPMEGIDPVKYDDILDLTADNLATVVVAAAGYRDAADKYAQQKKVRFSRDDVILRK